MIQVTCPHCQTVNRFDDNYAGMLVQCQQCNNQMQMPSAAPPPATFSDAGGSPMGGPRTSGLAITSMVLGIVGIVTACVWVGVLIGLVGLIFGIVALVQIRKRPDVLGGTGMAVAGIITGSLATLMVVLLLVGVFIFLPTFGRAREIANRSVCGANMKGIMMAMSTYSVSNADQYPPDLSILVEDGSLGERSFFCPSEPMPDVPDLPLDELGDWLSGNTHYVYLGAGKGTSVPADAILLYEPLHHHDGEGINILFGDSHVQFFMIDEARELLAEQGIELPPTPIN